MPTATFTSLVPADLDEPLGLYTDAARPAPPDRPWVMANMVAGLDGAIAVDGRVGPLSSPADRVVFRLLRSLADVILVGAGTVRAEGYGPARPTSQTRERRSARGQDPVPVLAVVTASLQLDWEAPFFTEAEARPLVVTTASSAADARARAERVADVIIGGEDRVEPAQLLAELHTRGIGLVLCEGGPSINTDLVAARLLDELCLTLTPMVGGDPVRVVADDPRLPLTRFALAHAITSGGELYLRYLATSDEVDPGTGDD